MSKYIFQAEQAHNTAWIASGAVVVGDVHLAEESSVWFNAVLRGDTETLRIGARTNIQDLSMLHADPGFPVEIGHDCVIGHRVIIHGAIIGDTSLIGMGAILLNGATVGEESIVGAGALLTQNKVYPSRSLILGSPAKVVRSITDEEVANIRKGAEHYVQKAKEHRGY